MDFEFFQTAAIAGVVAASVTVIAAVVITVISAIWIYKKQLNEFLIESIDFEDDLMKT